MMFLLDWIISFFSCHGMNDSMKRNDSPQRSLRSDRKSYTRNSPLKEQRHFSSGGSNGGSRKSRRSRGSSKRNRRSNSFDQGLGYRYDELQQPRNALIRSDRGELLIGHQNNMSRLRDDLSQYDEENFVPIHSSESLSKTHRYSNEWTRQKLATDKEVVIADNFVSYSKNPQKVSTNFSDIPKLVLVPYGSTENHGTVSMLGRYASILSDKSVAPPCSKSFDNLEADWDLQSQISQSLDDVIPSQFPHVPIDDNKFDESLLPGTRNQFYNNRRSQHKENRNGKRSRQHILSFSTNRSTVNRGSRPNSIPTKSRVFHPDERLTIISATNGGKSIHKKRHERQKSGLSTTRPQRNTIERSINGLSTYKQSWGSELENVAISPLSSEDVDPLFLSKNSGDSFPNKVVRFMHPETYEQHPRQLYSI